MKPPINSSKIVVLSGAGISAASGLATFRSSDGLWEKHRIDEVATPHGWATNPELVLNFYNERRRLAAEALPNSAHLAIASLESAFQVVIITQNVDDLHERAGSSSVIHLHGELAKVRSSVDPSLIYDVGSKPIHIGDLCSNNSQLRPHIVWFGDDIHHFEEARRHILEASKVLVVGTSLSVFPAAGLIKFARYRADKVLIDPSPQQMPYGFKVVRGSAEVCVPDLVCAWHKKVALVPSIT